MVEPTQIGMAEHLWGVRVGHFVPPLHSGPGWAVDLALAWAIYAYVGSGKPMPVWPTNHLIAGHATRTPIAVSVCTGMQRDGRVE